MGRRSVQKEAEKPKKDIKIQLKLDKKTIVKVVLFVIVILTIVAINNYTNIGLVLDRNISTKDAIKVELQTSNNKIIPFGNEILVYNKGKLISYNANGKSTGEIKLEDTIEADVKTCGKYIQITNKDKSIIYVYKNKYEVARIKLEGKIYSTSINSDGTSIVEYSTSGNKMELGVYDKSGEKKYNVKLSNNVIGKYVLSEDSRKLVYIDVNIEGISAQTNIKLIDLTNIKEDGTNAKTIYTKDNDLAYDIYWHGSEIIIRFDEEYVIYNTRSGKTQNIKIAEGQLVQMQQYAKRYAFVQISDQGEYLFNLKKMTSDKVKTIKIKEAPKYFKYENGLSYICYQKDIEVYNNSGMKIKKYQSDTIITEPVIFNDGRSAVVPISNKLIIFTI